MSLGTPLKTALHSPFQSALVFPIAKPALNLVLTIRNPLSISVIEHGVVAREYAEGDFWGELALVFDHPRPATVRVFSAFAEVYVLSRQDFVRLVGNMTDVLGRNVTLHQFP